MNFEEYKNLLFKIAMKKKEAEKYKKEEEAIRYWR